MWEYLVITAGLVSILAALAYIHSMFKNNTKPNRVTWFMWSIAPLIATAAELSNGVGLAVLPVFISGLSPLLIFLASFFAKKAYWKLSNLDYFCGLLSGLALVLWLITKDPNVAIILAITSDAFAAIPTIKKAWKNPETESSWPFTIGMLSPLTAFLVANEWSFSELAFPIYLVFINILVVISIYNKKLRP